MPNTNRYIRDAGQVGAVTVFAIGVTAGAVYTMLSHLVSLPYRSQQEIVWGSFFMGTANGAGVWWTGFLVHLVLSGAIAFLYAMIFRSAHRSGIRIGLNLAIYHWAIAGFLMGLLPLVHPVITEVYPSPGFYMLKAGFGAAAFYFISHLAFGSIVGWLFDLAAMRDEFPEPITGRR